jgi:hypothetical protein
MDPRRWVPPRHSPTDPLPPIPSKGHGSSYDQKLIDQFFPPASKPLMCRPCAVHVPCPHVPSRPSSPMVPHKDEANQLDFEPVFSKSKSKSTPIELNYSNLPTNIGTRLKTCLPPDNYTSRLFISKNAKEQERSCPGKAQIKDTSSFSTFDNAFDNATFVDSVRNAPFIPSSSTLDYSEALDPIQVPYLDPPMDFADPPPAPMDDMNLYSFSTPSPEALDLSPSTKKDKGKRPFRLARFPRKVSKKNSLKTTSEKFDLEPLTPPPPTSPLPSTSQPYYSSESD